MCVTTGLEELYQEDMKNIIMKLQDDADEIASIAFDDYALQFVPSYAVAPVVGRVMDLNLCQWLIFTHVRRVLTHDDFKIMRQSRAGRVFNTFNSVRDIADPGLHISVNCYPSVSRLVTVSGPVSLGF